MRAKCWLSELFSADFSLFTKTIGLATIRPDSRYDFERGTLHEDRSPGDMKFPAADKEVGVEPICFE
jgi:hypothetical protein